MPAYWERRIEGRRFFDWLMIVFGPVLVGLILLRPRPLETVDYVGIAVFSPFTLQAAWRLFKGSRPPRTIPGDDRR